MTFQEHRERAYSDNVKAILADWKAERDEMSERVKKIMDEATKITIQRDRFRQTLEVVAETEDNMDNFLRARAVLEKFEP